MIPGCRGKAHKPEHLGYAGRRVLVSRKWSNKTLTEHKQDRAPGSCKPSANPTNPPTYTAPSGGPSQPETPTCRHSPSASLDPSTNANAGAPTSAN
jgi:hypothetical protein